MKFHFPNFQDFLVSKINRASIDACKNYFRDDLQKDDWKLMIELKKTFEIMWWSCDLKWSLIHDTTWSEWSTRHTMLCYTYLYATRPVIRMRRVWLKQQDGGGGGQTGFAPWMQCWSDNLLPTLSSLELSIFISIRCTMYFDKSVIITLACLLEQQGCQVESYNWIVCLYQESFVGQVTCCYLWTVRAIFPLSRTWVQRWN